MNIAAKYNRAAPQWEAKIRQLGYNVAYADFLENCALKNGAVLDVGAGTGALSRAWIAVGGSRDLTLLDISSAMLEKARDGFRAIGVLPKAVVCPFEDYSPGFEFDAALAAHILEHCADPGAALQAIARLLLPGGRLFLVVSKPHWCNWLIWLRFQHRWFAESEICDMAERAGLSHFKTHQFTSGPPSRTSLGYVFTKRFDVSLPECVS